MGGKKQKRPTTDGLSGPKSVFRRKVRTRPSVVLTKPGHVKLEANLDRLDLSRSDYFEGLLHVYGDKITRDQIERAAEVVNADA